MTNVMVCVTQQKNCDRLIKYGKKMLESDDGELFIIHIASYEYKFLGHAEDGEALEYLYQKALEYGANLTVVRSNNILSTLSELVDKNKIDHVVMGESRESTNESNMTAQFEKKVKGKVGLSVLPSLPE